MHVSRLPDSAAGAMRVEIRQLRDAEWHTIPNATFAGWTKEALLRSFDDTDTVCKVETTKGVVYWCGKQKYVKMMRDKGNMAWLCVAVADYSDHMEQIENAIDVFGTSAIPVPENISLRDESSYCNATQGELSI